MTGPESLSPGGQANLNFVIKTRAEEPGLEELIPEGCRYCSTAWNRARRGQGLEHVKVCTGPHRNRHRRSHHHALPPTRPLKTAPRS
jgi:hypothetical protein